MAKKKAVPEAPPPESEKAQRSIITLKGTVRFRAWLAGLTKKSHVPAATLVRLGLAEMAKKYDHEPPPEK